MKKNTGHIWLAALGVLGVGALGIWGYEAFYAATTISAGAYTMPTPGSGNITLALPSGSQSWSTVNYIGNGGATAPTVPTAPGNHLSLGVVKNSVLTIGWIDSAGTPQVSIITFI